MANKNYGIGITVDFIARDIVYPDFVVIPFNEKNLSWDAYLINKKNAVLTKPAREFKNLIINNYAGQYA